MAHKKISTKFTLQTQRKTEYGGQCKRSYNKYKQFLISAIKGITKDCLSLQYVRSM